MNAPVSPHLLALDWGTSSLRAFLMQDGQVIETRQSAHGIQHLPAPGQVGAAGIVAGGQNHLAVETQRLCKLGA